MRITLLSALIPTFAVTTSAFTPFHCATRVSTGRSSFTRQVTSLRLYESNIGSTVKTVFASVDENQSIGKRYAKHDEIGTPFCITVDGESITDQAATLRFRDTCEQERIPIAKIAAVVNERLQK